MANIFFCVSDGSPAEGVPKRWDCREKPTMTERRNERQRRADVATAADEVRGGNAHLIIKTIHPAKCSNGFFRSWGRGRVLRKGGRD